MLLLKIHCSVLWHFLIIYLQETVKFGHKKEHLLGHPLYWFYFFIVIIIQESIPWTETIDLCYRLWRNFGYNPQKVSICPVISVYWSFSLSIVLVYTKSFHVSVKTRIWWEVDQSLIIGISLNHRKFFSSRFSVTLYTSNLVALLS